MILKKCGIVTYATSCVFIMCSFLVTSCDTPYTVWSHETIFSVFRFQNAAYMEYVLVDSVKDNITGQYSLQLHGTARRGVKQFFISDSQSVDAFYNPISKCEISNEKTLYYPLHDGYYICFPFNGLISGRYMSSCKWEDLCEVRMDTAHVILPANKVFTNIHAILGLHVSDYCKKKVDRLTLDDVVRYTNMLIDQYKDHPVDWEETSEILEHY